ncbi:MAG: kelch repeat-containing protein, partial [Endomicrobiia bacterium]|nr:kelch repeat-containing protein [Endomicrobiia bacterium]
MRNSVCPAKLRRGRRAGYEDHFSRGHLSSVLFSSGFASSTKTFSTDTEFSFFQKDNIVVAGSGSAAFLAVENRWTQFVIAGPSSRSHAAVSASTAMAIVLLHGGSNPAALNDFWIYDPSETQWTQRSASGSPSARYGHCVSPISAGKFILFGGLGAAGYFGDTYVYDAEANSWQRPSFAVEPSSRAHFASALDTKRNRVYIFGGQAEGVLLADLWYYDAAAGEWNDVAQVSTIPSARYGSALVYDPVADTLLLFGGNNDSANIGDLWHFSYAASSWTQISQPVTRPAARRHHGFVWDRFLGRAVLFGGAINTGVANDIWVYNMPSNLWSSAAPLTAAPAGRYGFGMAYCGYNFVFGGAGPSAPGNDTWKYVAASSGVFITNVISEYTPTGIRWQTVDISPPTSPGGTSRDFQISASTDGINWTDFAGPDGDVNQYFVYGGAPIQIDHSLWRNKPNLRIKCRMFSNAPPVSPSVEELLLRYNRPPYAPSPSYPIAGKRVGLLSPYFIWERPSDPDSDPVGFYELQVATNAAFSPVFFSSAGIYGDGFQTVTSTPGAGLYEGAWHYRVRASDPEHYGSWSSGYDFRVDTTPPAAVADFTAARGNVNGKIFLAMKVPGDDGASSNLVNATCLVRYSSYPIITEGDWSGAAGSKDVAVPNNTPPGTALNVDVSGLADAATYYFNARIRDGASNLGALYGASPSAATNCPPVINIVASPSGTVSGDVFIEWVSSDSEDDEYKHRVFASSDGAASFGVELTVSPLAKSATFYILNTKRVKNGQYALLVSATDEPFGLSSGAVSAAFIVDNPNESPAVSISSPAAGSIISGVFRARWTITDPNLCDAHSSVIRFSSDGGSTYAQVFASTTDYYDVNTRLLPNGTAYVVKITATDDGSPSLSSSAISGVFGINNENLPPGRFALLSPPDKKYRSALGFYFSWAKAEDPNPEDTVIYKIEYSTRPDFSDAAVADNIVATSFHVPTSALLPGATYYWRVRARDPFLRDTFCDAPFEFYVLDRFGASTPTNHLAFKVLNGLPPDAFVFVSEYNSAYVPSARVADSRTIGDPFTKTVSGGEIYRVGFYDAASNEVAPDSDVEIEVVYDYSLPSSSLGAPSFHSHSKDSILRLRINARVALLDE